MKLAGAWHIQSMEMWDEDYFNMEVQAYITIKSNYTGEFQFGLVTGDLDGSISVKRDNARLHLSWEGGDENDPPFGRGWCKLKVDENDPAFGRGWCKLKDNDTLEGEITFQMGDRSGFEAVRTA